MTSRVHTDGTSIAFATHRLPLPEPVAGSLTRKDGEMILGFRPEHFSVTSSSEDGPTVPATVEHTEQLGSEALVYFHLEAVAAKNLGADSEAELTGAFVARLDSRVRTGRASSSSSRSTSRALTSSTPRTTAALGARRDV